MFRNAGMVTIITMLLAACQGAKHSFTLVPDEQSFQQNSLEVVQRKIDILWVVDNSGSMTPFQQSLTENFQAFLQDFLQKDYDFHLAVTTTDAYLADPQFRNQPTLSKFRDGGTLPARGFPLIDNQTPDPLATFTANALQGSSGSGDERAFSSFKASLSNPANSQFLRKDSFLAIIILSNEDDFSNPTRPERTTANAGTYPDQNYSDPGLESIDSYVSYLDQLTLSQNENRNYTVSAVTVLNQECVDSYPGQGLTIGRRVIELAQKTGGVLGSICSPNYSQVLNNIQKRIIELSTEFPLKRIPKLGSIRVHINGDPLIEDAENGWTYNSVKNSILFHGKGVPPKAATVSIYFEPAESLKPHIGQL
ncbi:MAG: hypothetical protein ACAH59_11835 [Pseudobdellovibrionaceae bacterium]